MAMIVVFFLFILILTVFWHQKHVFRLAWQLPGPLPLLGSNLAWINVTGEKNELIPFFDHLSKMYRSPIRLFIGPKPIIFISDAKNAQVILNSKDCLNKPDQFYKAFRDALSFDGLITLEGTTQIQEEYYGSTATLYNPNRLLDENVMNLPSTTNMPYSFGSRNCVGYFYAQVGLKLYVGHLVRNYYLETSYKTIAELKPLLTIGMGLVDKHMIKLIRRN